MSKFIPWISDENVVENTNVYDYENFNSVNSQSKNGFQSGNVISSTYMNSALRQANLVIAALMECTGNNTLDLTSSVADVKSALQTYFSGLYVARATSDSDGTNIKANYAKQNGTYNNMTVGTATKSTKLKLNSQTFNKISDLYNKMNSLNAYQIMFLNMTVASGQPIEMNLVRMKIKTGEYPSSTVQYDVPLLSPTTNFNMKFTGFIDALDNTEQKRYIFEFNHGTSVGLKFEFWPYQLQIHAYNLHENQIISEGSAYYMEYVSGSEGISDSQSNHTFTLHWLDYYSE